MEHPEQDEMVHGALNALDRAREHVDALLNLVREDAADVPAGMEIAKAKPSEAEVMERAVQHVSGIALGIGQAVVYALIDIAENTRRQ